MVVVRESPRAKLSPDKNTTQWPPKSPFQALLSSPSGRKRWEERQSRATHRTPSPSPLKRPSSSRAMRDLVEMAHDDDEEDNGEDDEDDEEIVQLKLQQIEAKLKLAKLRKAKKQSGDTANDGRESRQERALSPRRPALSPPRSIRNTVEVPISPVRTTRIPQEQLSPARQRLGLTSNSRAEDVSLKRARDGSHVKRATPQTSLRSQNQELPKPKTFAERLAESKQDTDDKQAKKDRIERIRSSGFSHAKSETPSSARRATSKPIGQLSRLAGDLTRPSSAGRIADLPSTRKEAAPMRSVSARIPREKEAAKPHVRSRINPSAYGQDSGTGHAQDDSDLSIQIEPEDGDAGFDPFSKVHLTKRHIQHEVIAREMESREVYTIPRLLKEVTAPHYDPPDCESDYVVFGVLASKSSPFDHAQTHKTNEPAANDYEPPRNKFMVLHLCDLKWEIDCFLFGSAFTQFWKLTPGTLLAILNPAVMPPKGNQHNGRFSLKLGSSEDAVMEIGLARDLGYCSAVKKDGQPCGEWVDKRKTEACEFHINLQIEKNRKGRMEVNTMFRGAGNPGDKIKGQAAREKRGTSGRNNFHHREYGQLYTVNTGMGKSAANLLDGEDTDALHNMTQEEASRKRIADAQKERDLAKQLSQMGTGVGAEYMRAKHTHTAWTSTTTTATSARTGNSADEAREALFEKPSAADLGLLGKKAGDAHLSPAKDRKKHFGLGAASLHNANGTAHKSSEPMGWGGARKAGLLQPKENTRLGSPERGQTTLDTRPSLVRSRSQASSMRSNGSSSPVKKKARFVLEKGIREPGRDSLPGASLTDAAVPDGNDDDDDDLDIV